MAKVVDVISIIESIAPLETAEEWDNSGWQINLHNDETKKILACLSVTEDVLDFAIESGCDLIISHHPLIFSLLKKLENPLHIRAIQHNIQIYAAHTNFDKAKDGTSDMLCEKLQLKNINPINDYVKFGELPFEMTLDKFLDTVKSSLSVEKIKLSGLPRPHYVQARNDADIKIKTVAVCAGSGADFIPDIIEAGANAYITSDVKYHAALEVKDMVLLDIGHFESERFFSGKIKELLGGINIETVVANEKPAWIII